MKVMYWYSLLALVVITLCSAMAHGQTDEVVISLRPSTLNFPNPNRGEPIHLRWQKGALDYDGPVPIPFSLVRIFWYQAAMMKYTRQIQSLNIGDNAGHTLRLDWDEPPILQCTLTGPATEAAGAFLRALGCPEDVGQAH